jgi:hypothetical protein
MWRPWEPRAIADNSHSKYILHPEIGVVLWWFVVTAVAVSVVVVVAVVVQSAVSVVGVAVLVAVGKR